MDGSNLLGNLNASDQGVIYKNSGSSVLTGADLLIDFLESTTTKPNFVIGGYNNGVSGNIVTNNTVTIKNGIIDGNVYGGLSHITEKTNDKVNSSGNADTSISKSSQSISVKNNQVVIQDGTDSLKIYGSVYGGTSVISYTAGNASAYNQAQSAAYATYSKLSANENSVSAGNNNQITGSIFGGNAAISLHTGTADSSSTASSKAVSTSSVEGSTLSANENSVSIGSNNQITGSVFGGNTAISLQSGKANYPSTASSSATTSSSTVSSYGSTLSANENSVSIGSNNQITGSVFGGNTTISLQTAIANSSATAATSTASSYGATLSANENSVSVGSNNQIGGSVFGGNTAISLKTADSTSPSNPSSTVYAGKLKLYANQNTVNFNGNLTGANSDIIGGSIVFDVKTGSVTITSEDSYQGHFINDGSLAQAINNTVFIEQNATFNNTSSLYGGYLSYNTADNYALETYNVFSGNTLNYAASTPTTISTVANFENYNFTLTPSLANTGTALISAQNIVLGADTTNTNDATVSGTYSKVAVVGIYSGKVLNANDEFILMESSNPFTGSGAVGQSNYGVAQQGISLLYDVRTDVDTENKRVTATILGSSTASGGGGSSGGGESTVRVNPQLKALSEGYMLNSQLVNRGADMIAYDALAAINTQNNKNGWVPFATTSAQHIRYNSGSHIKSNDYLLTGGISYQQDNSTVAALIEGGWGGYDSYNSFNNAANVHGDGNSNYYGIGILGRYDFDNGIYTEGSLRYGRSHVKFDTNDILNIATGENANYKLNTNYASAHVGVGYIIPFDKKNDLDLSAKYLYATTQGKDVNVAGDNIHFDRVNSSRVRLNAALNHQYSDTVTLNTGVGYEYEFDGKAKATTYGIYNIDAPSLKGSTGIVSVGVMAKPSENSKLTFEVNGQGYLGKREGVGLNFRAYYVF